MKPSERAQSVHDFLSDNATNFGNLLEQHREHPAAPLLQQAVDSYLEAADEQNSVVKALADREAVVLHVRGVCETACDRARLELQEGKEPADIVERLRETVLRAIPLKAVPK